MIRPFTVGGTAYERIWTKFLHFQRARNTAEAEKCTCKGLLVTKIIESTLHIWSESQGRKEWYKKTDVSLLVRVATKHNRDWIGKRGEEWDEWLVSKSKLWSIHSSCDILNPSTRTKLCWGAIRQHEPAPIELKWM